MEQSRGSTGSFRFYSDEGVEAPSEDGHLRHSPQHNEDVQQGEKEKDDGPELLFPDAAAATPPAVNGDDAESITSSVVNVPIPREVYLDEKNRVSSRLFLAQEHDMVPVHHSRGSEVASKKKGFEEMKQHLHNLVQAADLHLQSTMELQQAQRAFYACLADLADDTPLKGVVGTAANHGETTTVLNPQQVGVKQDGTLVQKYQREILRHAKDWQDAVTDEVDLRLEEFEHLERRYFACNTKTVRLRKRVHIADSWNLEFVSSKIQAHLLNSEQELAKLVQEHKDMSNETCFLLDQVTAHGWKDLYPLVESTMEWEVDRVHHEEDTNGQILPVALEQLKESFQILEEEELNQPKSLHGMAPVSSTEPSQENDNGDGTEESKIEQSVPPTFRIDPHKPTLFLDDADPFTARVWITLLEKEADPLHPTGFHVIPVSNIKSDDPGLQLLHSINQGKSPVLVHNGNIFTDSIRVSEYIDKAIRHPLYHSIPSLLPSSPIATFNMKTFLKRHARLSDVFYNLMDSDDDDARPQLAQELFDLLGLIDKDLQKFPGPYLCGSQFTLADVSIFPFVEHINIILASFGGTSIPASLSCLLEWYDVVSRRPSVQMVTADPVVNSNSISSTNGQNQGQGKKRGEYLIEYHQQRCDFVADA